MLSRPLISLVVFGAIVFNQIALGSCSGILNWTALYPAMKNQRDQWVDVTDLSMSDKVALLSAIHKDAEMVGLFYSWRYVHGIGDHVEATGVIAEISDPESDHPVVYFKPIGTHSAKPWPIKDLAKIRLWPKPTREPSENLGTLPRGSWIELTPLSSESRGTLLQSLVGRQETVRLFLLYHIAGMGIVATEISGEMVEIRGPNAFFRRTGTTFVQPWAIRDIEQIRID